MTLLFDGVCNLCNSLVQFVIRDAVYRFIARNRYRFFGNQDACLIPTPELKSRFLP